MPTVPATLMSVTNCHPHLFWIGVGGGGRAVEGTGEKGL